MIKRIWILVYISLFLFLYLQGKKQEGLSSAFHLPYKNSITSFSTMILWKPHFSHYPAIKPTPENARILLLAPTALVDCARITSAAADFNIAAQHSHRHRDDGPNQNILMAALGGWPQYWSPKHLCSASYFDHLWEVAAVFGFGRVEVSRNVVVLIWLRMKL
jgi:hypothetical protein